MDAQDILHVTKTAQEKYADALRNNDRKGMLEQARTLYRSYARGGDRILAGKWTDEYIRCWMNRGENPPDDRGGNDNLPGSGAGLAMATLHMFPPPDKSAGAFGRVC